uniref:Uncharacterized protein n=1 Tax=Cacopsylla melanoneura TaxID=428564 RepID=A0A8D8W9X9_9HEMI
MYLLIQRSKLVSLSRYKKYRYLLTNRSLSRSRSHSRTTFSAITKKNKIYYLPKAQHKFHRYLTFKIKALQLCFILHNSGTAVLPFTHLCVILTCKKPQCQSGNNFTK